MGATLTFMVEVESRFTLPRTTKGLSLRARGKKPMSSFHSLLMEQISAAPRLYLIKRIEQLILEKAPKAPKAFIREYAKHIVTTPAETFEWTDEREDAADIELTLTAEEILPLIEEAEKFVENELPAILPKIVKSSAKVILKSLKADWSAQRAHDEARMIQFRENLLLRWQDAFDTLRMIYTISLEVGGEIVKSRRRSRSKKNRVLNDTLIRLHARACQVTFEVITLMENGLADGAMARWRTLHEIVVVAELLTKHGEELAVRYRAHELVEAKRAMDRFVLFHEQLGYAPPSKRDVVETEKDYKAVLELYGDRFGSEYGWAAEHLNIKKPRMVDLEAAAGQAAMQSYYRMASYNVHASSKGIAFRLGLLDSKESPVMLAGASNAGFVEPARNTAADIVHITCLLAHGTARFDRMVEWQILIQLRDDLFPKLDRAHRDLEKSHRAQEKIEARRRKLKGK